MPREGKGYQGHANSEGQNTGQGSVRFNKLLFKVFEKFVAYVKANIPVVERGRISVEWGMR